MPNYCLEESSKESTVAYLCVYTQSLWDPATSCFQQIIFTVFLSIASLSYSNDFVVSISAPGEERPYMAD